MLDRDGLLAYVRAVHERTYEAVARMDDALVDWRPMEDEFSGGEIVAHIAASRAMNVRSLRRERPRYEGHELPPRAGWNFVRRLAEHSSAETLRRLANVDFTRDVLTASGLQVPAWRLAIAGLIEHEVHHRSQLCSYLGACGVEPPPLYGLHAEDLPP